MSRKDKIISMVQDHDRFIGIGNVKQSGYLAKEIFHELIGYVDDLEERVAKLETPNATPARSTTPATTKKAPAAKKALKTGDIAVKKESESISSTPAKRPVKKNVKV